VTQWYKDPTCFCGGLVADENLIQEYIPADEYRRTMEAYQASIPSGGVAPEINRRQVVSTILETFHLVGGINKFAVWAQENPDQFYAMWSKQAPKSEDLSDGGALKVIHVVPRSALDD
jgi:hypothetical protein